MSDLAATNCGCDCGDNNGCGNFIWIILLLACCGCNNGSFFSNNGNDCGCNNIWIIILLLFCCNGNNGCF